MPTEFVMKNTRKIDIRPFQIDLRVTWPDKLEDGSMNQFVLDYRSAGPWPQDVGWHMVGAYNTRASAEQAAVGFTNNTIDSDEWAQDDHPEME